LNVRVAPIVEGHGEVEAVRLLLERIWIEEAGATGLQVLTPIRQPRLRLTRSEHLLKAVELALLKLGSGGGLVLLMLDNDPSPEPPCALAPALVDIVRQHRSDADFACVLANPEYETWFVAAAESLSSPDVSLPPIPEDPEAGRMKKAWVKKYLCPNYSETVDQPALTARMDLAACRRRSPSFDKLCRELEAFHQRCTSPD
jgi:hypothetical protein